VVGAAADSVFSLNGIVNRSSYKNANYKPIGSDREKTVGQEDEYPGLERIAPETWRLREGVHHHPEKTELSLEKGGEGAVDQWYRGHFLYSRHRT
jgi:hypothetical protein